MDRVPAVVLFVFLAIYSIKIAASTVCVDSCSEESDGNYQYCSTCRKYVTCLLGYMFIMSCPTNLVWDDNMKRCEWTSSTCPESTTARASLTRTIPNMQGITVCMDSCSEESNGNYQYCLDCQKYVICFLGYKYIMSCPADLVWDDNMKRCEWTSSTCTESTTVITPLRRTTPSMQRRKVCVDSCAGERDGNYQHCSDCHQYVTCSNGYKYLMPCPSNLVWDDTKKRCEWTSHTCNTTAPSRNNVTSATTPIPGCLNTCVGRSDGNYQYCSDCHQYVACSNGYDYIMPCPSNLVWDDLKKRCEWTSSTCIKTTPESNTTTIISNTGCMDSCAGQRDGNYQHCLDCHQYVACSNGHKFIMPCPSNLVWDDTKKNCEWMSPTCKTTAPSQNSAAQSATLIPSCVDSCTGLRDGNYQHCSDCHQYVACSNEYKYVMPCPSNLVWDDAKKRCEWTSPTCNTTAASKNSTTPATKPNLVCVDSCSGKSNGNYQYCPDCRKYVTCSNDYNYIMPCPDNLVWDDNMKTCEWVSSTCPESTTARTTTSARRTTPNIQPATVCVDSCSGKSNGNYQYCPDCRKYVTCSNGYKYIMSCPASLVWDDNTKICQWTSTTCSGPTTARMTTLVKGTTPNKQQTTASSLVCFDSCSGKSDGNYQYCPDCRKYVTCSNGYKYIMPCPASRVWDDNTKRCEWTSSTCSVSSTARTSTPSRGTTQNVQLSLGCVDSCVGLTDGDYQYCSDCHKFVSCSNNAKYIMSCPSNLIWDDVIKRCEWMSSTCPLN